MAILGAPFTPSDAADRLDLTKATVLVRDGAPLVEQTAATVLVEEVARRTGSRLRIATQRPDRGWAIALTSGPGDLAGMALPEAARVATPEGYALLTDPSTPDRPVLWVAGADPRGALFGVGGLLRTLECRHGKVELPGPLSLRTSPRFPIRGHQLGYRATANSYDAWSPEQFDTYIRELALFGSNAVEGIPFQDNRPTVNPYPRGKMNVEISRICRKYGQAYWLWVPADFDLRSAARREAALKEHEALFKECPELTGIFVAGGDPGDNPPQLVIPYLKDLSVLLAETHPDAGIWLSMQGYEPAEQDAVYHWIQSDRPAWLGGLVGGPSSPSLPELRRRLPAEYKIRDYPDITHSVRCQFPVPWWDPAFAFTLGRECTNPRPRFFQRIIHDTMPYTSGFISYSDGVHDDVNKAVWSGLAWDPDADLHELLAGYCRLHFGPDLADEAAAGILALESNWEGPVATNGSVDATLALWSGLDERAEGLKGNWRWQMCLLRANYDAYVRHRLRYESRLELQANAAILTASTVGSGSAIDAALAILKRAETEPVRKDLSRRVVGLCEELHKSIGLQTSVEKYQASGSERGCVLDFLEYPLNNRWWLEDEMAKVRAMDTEPGRVARLTELARWEQPGPGSFYDAIGVVGKSPHEVRNERIAAPILDMDHMGLPGVMWWVGSGPLPRARQTWFTSEDWPQALKYTALDPAATYVIRTTGCGECLLRANGVRLAPTLDGKAVGEIKEFPVPRGLYLDGNLTVTFDPTFEPTINWRQQSRLCEIWLLKR